MGSSSTFAADVRATILSLCLSDQRVEYSTAMACTDSDLNAIVGEDKCGVCCGEFCGGL